MAEFDAFVPTAPGEYRVVNTMGTTVGKITVTEADDVAPTPKQREEREEELLALWLMQFKYDGDWTSHDYPGFEKESAEARRYAKEILARLRAHSPEEPVAYTSSYRSLGGISNRPFGRCTLPLYANPIGQPLDGEGSDGG